MLQTKRLSGGSSETASIVFRGITLFTTIAILVKNLHSVEFRFSSSIVEQEMNPYEIEHLGHVKPRKIVLASILRHRSRPQHSSRKQR